MNTYYVKQRTEHKKIEELYMFNIENNTKKCDEYDYEISKFLLNDQDLAADFINNYGLGLVNNPHVRLCYSLITEINFLWIYNLYFDKSETYIYRNSVEAIHTEYGMTTSYCNINNIYNGLINKKIHYKIILRIIFCLKNHLELITMKFIERYINLCDLYFETFNEYPEKINDEVKNAIMFIKNKMENPIEYAKKIILGFDCIISDYKYPINFLIKCFEIIKNDIKDTKEITIKESYFLKNKVDNFLIKEYEILEYLYNYYKIKFINYEPNNKTNKTKLFEKNKPNQYLLKNTVINYNYLNKIFNDITLNNEMDDKELIMFLKNNSVNYKNLLIFIKNNYSDYIYLLFENVIKNKDMNIKKKFKLDNDNNKKIISNITFDFKNYIITKKLKIKDYFIVDKKLSKLLNEPISKMLKIENISFI